MLSVNLKRTFQHHVMKDDSSSGNSFKPTFYLRVFPSFRRHISSSNHKVTWVFVSKSVKKCEQTKTLCSVEDSTNETELCFLPKWDSAAMKGRFRSNCAGCRYSSCDLVQVHLIQNLPQLQQSEQHGWRESLSVRVAAFSVIQVAVRLPSCSPALRQ